MVVGRWRPRFSSDTCCIKPRVRHKGQVLPSGLPGREGHFGVFESDSSSSQRSEGRAGTAQRLEGFGNLRPTMPPLRCSLILVLALARGRLETNASSELGRTLQASDESRPRFLYYNRIPKAGSSSLINILIEAGRSAKPKWIWRGMQAPPELLGGTPGWDTWYTLQ